MVVTNQHRLRGGQQAREGGVTIPSESNIKRKEHKELEKNQRVERGAGKDVGSKGFSGISGDKSTQG